MKKETARTIGLVIIIVSYFIVAALCVYIIIKVLG